MRLRPLVFGAMLTAGVGSSASAQSLPPVPTVSAQREVKLGLRLAVYHDSNVARASKATAAARGVVLEDEYLRPSATAQIVQPFGRQALFLQGAAGYDFYRRNTQLDRQRFDVTGGAVATLASCHETVFANYKASQSDLADLDLGTSKNLQRTTGYGVSVDCGRATGLRGNMAAFQSQAKNSASTRSSSDADTKTLAFAAGYGQPTLGTLSLLYSHSDSQFPNRIIATRPIGDGFFTDSLGLSYQRRVGQRINVAATVSDTRVKREFAPPGARQKFSSLSYSGTASYRPSNRMQFDLAAQRSIVPSQRTGKLYDITEGGTVSTRYNLGTRFTLGAGYARQDTKSNNDTTGSVLVVTKSRSNTQFVSVDYRQSELISLLLDVRREDRKTNVPSFNYVDNRIGLTAEVSF